MHLATLITVLSIGFLLVYVLVKGIPNLNADIFSWEYTSDNCSLVPALINTVYMTLLSLLIAGPIGIFAAIYLVEYAKTGNKLVGVVRITAETLTGIPSIVYGLFGMLFFTNACGLRLSLISGALTLSIMVLPVIMRTTEEALMAVPKSYREGSFGLGAGRLSTHIHSRIGCKDGNESYRFYQNPGGSYVSSLKRGTTYRSGLCNSGSASCACSAYQLCVRQDCRQGCSR